MDGGEGSETMSRREALRLSALVGMGSLWNGGRQAARGAGPPGGAGEQSVPAVPAVPPEDSPEAISAALDNNIYTRLLGVRPHLGAHEHISRLSGSRMPPQVIEAMAEANRFFVDMNELMAAAGKRIAEVMGAEAALVTAGGFSSMVLGAAACLTGSDRHKMDELPHPTWPKRECLIHATHRFSYDRAYRQAGMEIVEVETREAFRARLGEKTAMIAALAAVEKQRTFAPPFSVRRVEPAPPDVMMPEELIRLGNEAGVPVLLDMASDLPPADNLTRFIEMGADLVVVSGGKGILGPQSTGILAGRRDLIEAARMQSSPNEGIGRGMKVGKEEVVGLIVALNRYSELDHQSVIEEWNRKARWLADQLQDLPGLTAQYGMNTMGYADVELTWDETIIPLSNQEAQLGLMEGSPRMTYDVRNVRTRQLTEGELQLVARRLRQFFEEASSR